MAKQDLEDLARQAFAAWNAHEADRLLKLLDRDYVWEADAFPTPLRGHEQVRQMFEMYVRAFPDLHFDVEQMLVADPYVVTRWHSSGTHRGEFMGIAPTNRRGELHGCTVTEFRNGKAVHEWAYFDNARLLQTIGALHIGRAA